jgi:K+-sensing histidine kinase KdpD
MAGRRMRPGIVRWLSGLLASVLMIAAASGLLVLLKPWVEPLPVVYILAVVPVAVVWGTGLAALTAVLSAAVYDYLFVPPLHSMGIADLRSAVALGHPEARVSTEKSKSAARAAPLVFLRVYQ